MIDYENKIFGIIYQAVTDYDSDIYVTKEKSVAPPSFPAVYVEQTDSYNPPEYAMISSYEEVAARVVTTVEVYSAKPSGKRQEAKSIFAVIDTAMRRNGFRRTTQNYLDLTDINNNAINKAVIRLLARYERLYVE
jgi:hypothetical protein